MIVFKYTYDTSVGEFTPTFNSGYTYTTKTSTTGTLKTVTIESDTAFTGLSWGSSSKSSVTKIDLIDVSGLKSLVQVFYGFTKLTSITVVNATTTLLDINHAFYGDTVLTDITFTDCDFTAVNNMGNCFNGGANSSATNVTFTNVKFNNISKGMISALRVATNMKIENCDFSQATNMNGAFANCVGLTGTLDLSTIPFSPNVTDMSSMFSHCTNLTKIIMPKGDFPLLTNMNGLCFRCSNLKEIDFSNFSAKGASISFSQTFGECHVLEEIDLSSLGATSTGFHQMVYNCLKIKKVNLSGVKMATGVTCNHMFYAVSTMEWIDISNFYATPTDVSNFNNTNKNTIKNIGALYCPANVINYYANLMVNNGNVCNIYYHDAKLEDLTVDSRFNYIYCEEYHGDVVSTPDDLELYSFTDTWDNITITDSLDLTTGIVTKNMGILDITDINTLIYSGYDSTNDLYNVSCSFANFPNIVAKGNNTLASSNILERKWYTLEGLYSHGIGNKFEFRISGTRGITSGDEAKQWVIDNLIMFYERTPEIIQLDINPLKSYRNGSITTSSQQLAPTLKTTLPVSNKFTTTNLTSGATYNIYFDGTATKLDAGGTIITNPVSPCEVECGGTTLTIEGTDIQNVRVLETTNKNEVGSVCGTTDVELSRIKTKCSIHNYFNDYSQDGSQWSKDWNCSSVRDDNKVIVTTNTFSYAGFTIAPILSYGTYKFHCKVKVAKVGDKYRVLFHGNPNGATNDTGGFAWAETTSTQLVEEINYVGYFRGAGIALFYGYSQGQVVEYYDISLIKLSDEDITGTDTSSINYSQTTSDLEQPIKLRSLGNVYDSYDLATGILTKRIGVSETDGSYSVLSSPIVITPKYKMLQDNNIMPDSFPQMMDSAYIDFLPTQLLPNTTYTVFLDATTAVGQLECGLLYNGDWYDGMKKFTVGVQSFVYTTNNQIDRFGGFRIRGWGSIINNLIMVQGEYSLDYYNPITPPHLYTNGQVKVYSDSEVYPTTILNGQSTNNYEINELNTSNNYTIRYEGECESISLANKSNTQGNNVLVKAGATSGNLTFVNGENIENVMLIESDVREQEINHFNGLQTVEVSRILIENQRNMSSQHYTIEDGSHHNYQRILPHYIKVEPNETLYANIGQNWVDWCSIYQYDEDKNRLSDIGVFGGYGTTQFKDSDGLYKNIITLSDNTHYIRIVLHNAFTSTFTLSRGDFLPPSTLAYNQYQGQYIDLPQPVQLNGLPDGTCDTYNPITGEYVQRVNGKPYSGNEEWFRGYTGLNCISYVLSLDKKRPDFSTSSYCTDLKLLKNSSVDEEGYFIAIGANYEPMLTVRLKPETLSGISFSEWLQQSGLVIFHEIKPITTQLTPINIPTFEGGILQLITTDGKVFPMVEYSMPTNNRYSTTMWNVGKPITYRNATEIYIDGSTTPTTPTETMTFTQEQLASGSIVINDNGDGLMVLNGDYTGRDIPYFTGMRSVESIEVETSGNSDQPLFGKGGRR